MWIIEMVASLIGDFFMFAFFDHWKASLTTLIILLVIIIAGVILILHVF